MREILYMFSLIISILLNASADVYRLRVTDELAQKDEFWVKNGAVETHEPQEKNPSTMKFVAVDDEMGSIKDDWIDSDEEDGNQKYKKPKIIYFKKDS